MRGPHLEPHTLNVRDAAAGAVARRSDRYARIEPRRRDHMTIAELDGHRYVSLATFRRNGTEVATPVWFAAVGNGLYVVSAGDSGKVKRIRNTSRARLAPCDVRGRVHGPWQNATARVITDPTLIARAQAALRAKY